MKSFWSDNSKAFNPFFDTPIAVEGMRTNNRKVAGNYLACIFDNGFADPFAEIDTDSNCRTYSISILAGDWLEAQPPQIGDKIMITKPDDCSPTLPMMNLVVAHVDQLIGDTWTLTAKEVNND